jgi:hypothetical protein
MADLDELKNAIIEKQNIILNKLTELPYKESMRLLASLLAIVSNLENMQTQSEIVCNRIISDLMMADHRTSFSKAETIMKSSDTYLKHKKISNLKQCASRESSLIKIHLQYLLKEKIQVDDEDKQ